ncbi:hypothetical protein FOZ62_018115, partial [Perkinsus olseni]
RCSALALVRNLLSPAAPHACACSLPLLARLTCRRRPLCYLSPDEFKSLMDNLPAVKRAMEEYKAKIPSSRVDNVDELQRLYHPDRRYKKAGGKGQVLIPYHRHGEQIMPLNIPNHKLGPYKEWYKQAKPDKTLYH